MLPDGFSLHEFGHSIENGAIEDCEADSGRLMAYGLGEMTLSDPRRTYEEDIPVLSDEAAGGQFHDLAPVDGGIE